MLDQDDKILMLFIEPTPYLFGLINELKLIAKNRIDVYFLDENITQPWELLSPYNLIPSGFFKRIKCIYRLVSNKHYKIIHVAGWGRLTCLLMILIAKLFKRTISVESDTPLTRSIGIKGFIKKILYPILFKRIDLFIAGGRRQIKYIEQYGIRSSRIVSAQMTVDVNSIRHAIDHFEKDYPRHLVRHELGIQSNQFVYLFVGRFVNSKGIDTLITAFNGIRNKNAVLMLVGSGKLKKYIYQQMANNKNIICLDRKNSQELIKIYYASDMLVLPAYKENWGLVINEAMAAKKPVIVSEQVGCIDDLVFPYETGLIIEAGNPSFLRAAMEYMLHATDLYQQMCMNCSKLISHWTLQNEANNIWNAWCKINKC